MNRSMSTKTHFLKNAGLYFLGNSLSKVVTFFLLPVFSKYILPSDFGYFDLSQAYIYLAIPIFSSEIYMGMLRFIREKQDQEENGRVIVSGFSFALLFLLVLGIVSCIPAITTGIKHYLYILVLTVVLLMQRYYINCCRGLGYNRLFVLTGVVSSLLVAVSNYVMIIFFHLGIESLFLSTILGFFYQVVHIELAVKLRRYFVPGNFDRETLKRLLMFSFPLSVGSILYFFLNYYNRMLIETEIGLSANGYFAIAGKFGLVLMFLTSAFTMAWQDFSFSNDRGENRNVEFSSGIHRYYQFLILSGSVLIFSVHFVFDYLVDPQYKAAYTVVALCIGVNILSATGDFITQTFLALNKSRFILYSSVLATALNVIIAGFSIRQFGINGVNIALIVAYFINVIVRMLYLDRRFGFSVNYGMFLLLIGYFAAVCWIYQTNNSLYNGLGLVIAIAISAFLFRNEVRTIVKKLMGITIK